MRDGWLAENVVEPLQEQVAHAWFVAAGRQLHQAAGAVVDMQSRVLSSHDLRPVSGTTRSIRRSMYSSLLLRTTSYVFSRLGS
jgi:hypothetical protein